MKWMLAVVMPLVCAFSLRSLIYDMHHSFWGWFVCSGAGAVYAFGFIMMTPQLFINYKLKSVAHLPWRFLCYRFVNTFIDDLFAFIIRMPMMHRVATMRDDVVFFAFLFQLWKYPVDASRAQPGVDMADSSNNKALKGEDKSSNKNARLHHSKTGKKKKRLMIFMQSLPLNILTAM